MALGRLAGREWSAETYLAGSAALALYIQHRPVTGLDLMAPTRRLRGPDRRDLLLDLVDLGLMKIAAIISRGTRRDFVDLYLLCRHLPITDLLARAAEKFGHVRDFPLQALKALADLSLIEGEPMPRLERPLAWQDVEHWLSTEVRRLGRLHAGLDPQGP